MVATVAAKQFIATIARQGHGHVLTGKAGYMVGGQDGVVGKGLAQMADQARQQVYRFGVAEGLMVLGTQVPGNLPGMGKLVEAFIGKADGVGLDRLLAQAGHGRHDDARIDAAGEEGPQRYIRDHAQAGGLQHQFAQRCAGIGKGERAGGLMANVPVAKQLFHPAVADLHRMGGRQLADGIETGARRGHILVAEELVQGHIIGAARQFRQ